MSVALSRGRLPAPSLAAHELLHEIGEQGSGFAVYLRSCDGGDGLLSRLGGGHLVRRAEDRLGHADRTQGPDEEGLRSVLRDGETELGQVGVDDRVAVPSGLFLSEGAADGPFVDRGVDAHGMSPLSVPSGAVRSKGTKRRFWTDNVARAGDRGDQPSPAYRPVT